MKTIKTIIGFYNLPIKFCIIVVFQLYWIFHCIVAGIKDEQDVRNVLEPLFMRLSEELGKARYLLATIQTLILIWIFR